MKKRTWIQMIATALSNGYVTGFAKGSIYQGSLKKLCVPGLNCYSCPGALGSCPLGSLQAVLGSRNFQFSFYMLGFFMLVGAVLGRVVCGFLCPFGLLQDLLYKIPFFKKVKNLPGHRYLIYLKYVILAVFVLLMPLIFVDIIGQGTPWFCKLICPAGTLEGGWTLAFLNPEIREATGWLFTWKSFLLIVILVLSMGVYRPFCKYLCPLGGIYGLFNPIAFYRIAIDEERCTKCKVCRKACPMDIPVYETPNSMECIRCGECKASCPHQAITIGFGQKTALEGNVHDM